MLSESIVPVDVCNEQRSRLPSFFKKLSYVLRGEGRRIGWMVVLFVLVSALELLSLGLIGPFIGAVVDPTLLGRLPQLTGVLGGIVGDDPKQIVLALGVALLALFSMKALTTYWAMRRIYTFTFQFRARLVERLMAGYLGMPYRFFIERNSASIVQSITGNTKTLGDDLLIPSLRICCDLLMLSAVGGFLFWVSPVAMSLLAGLLAAAILTYLRLVRPRVRNAGERSAATHERIIRGVNQGVGGIKEIKTLQAERYFLRETIVAANAYAAAQTTFYSLLSVPRYLMECALVAFVIVLSLVVTEGGEAAHLIPTLVMFGAAGIRILPAVSQLSASLASIHYATYALGAVYDDLHVAAGALPVAGSETPTHGFRSAALVNVTYRYGSSASAAVDQVSLEIKRGMSAGLIGESGAGKTTLVDILLGLHPIRSGQFLIDGVPIDRYGWGKWRNLISYIPQQPFLLDDSLERNIAFGQRDDQIDRERVMSAIEAAQLARLLHRLPDGLGTVLGERGVRLSGGERQRVALARAFYSGRNVLIFDEATSSLDNETEQQVIEVIDSLKGRATLIVIAHRLTTVKSCDVVYRMQAGRIVAVGSLGEVTSSAAAPIPGGGR